MTFKKASDWLIILILALTVLTLLIELWLGLDVCRAVAGQGLHAPKLADGSSRRVTHGHPAII